MLLNWRRLNAERLYCPEYTTFTEGFHRRPYVPEMGSEFLPGARGSQQSANVGYAQCPRHVLDTVIDANEVSTSLHRTAATHRWCSRFPPRARDRRFQVIADR